MAGEPPNLSLSWNDSTIGESPRLRTRPRLEFQIRSQFNHVGRRVTGKPEKNGEEISINKPWQCWQRWHLLRMLNVKLSAIPAHGWSSWSWMVLHLDLRHFAHIWPIFIRSEPTHIGSHLFPKNYPDKDQAFGGISVGPSLWLISPFRCSACSTN